MAAEDESNLEPLCAPNWGLHKLLHRSKVLHRVNVRNRIAKFILAETARSLGHEICNLNVNYGSIRKARLKFRKPTAQSAKASFDPFVPLL